MNTRRLISTLLCLALLFCIIPPYNHVSASSLVDLSKVITSGHYSIYSYENSSLLFNLLVDSDTGCCSFAFIEKCDPDYLHEYLFNLDQSNIDISSVPFWEDLIDNCFSNSDCWLTSYIPTSIIQSTPSVDSGTASTNESHYSYFMNFLTDRYGPARTNYHIGDFMEEYVIFSLYETVDPYVARSNTFYVTTTLSALAS